MNQYNIWNQSASNSQTARQHILPSSEGNFGSINHNQHPQQQQQPGFANAPASSPPDQSSLSPDALIARLNGLPTSSNYTNFIQSLDNPSVTQPYSDFDYDSHSNYSFHLPLELQGGVSSINSRRPSFAAEQTYTHTNSAQNFMAQPQFSLERFAQSNNFQMSQGNAQNTASFDFRSRPLQQAFAKTKNYFCAESALSLYDDLCKKSAEIPFLQKVILNLKKLNNMFSLIKPVVLVLTKSGKYEILSIPANSNIRLQKNDVVIVDGDRGKDLVYVLAPSITLDVAILINYLKKRQHSKSISYGGTVQNNSGISNTVTDLVKGQGILDEETQFQIPTKQVLRFATYQEISNLQFKLIEEIKSFKTSLLKISNQPLLNGNLTILNSEYQFDQKKLTFFYYSNQRLDFRNLIKELFKIYKTRIWLCAVPKPEGQVTTELSNDVGIEDCLIDDFHVRSFANTLSELLAGA
ncbi:Protein PSP1 [Cyberlindnera fabianii]|uniref:Protein PSP1 n=1 Tax=Cyberlindnera fabianii TaxID=36022 RepID=A0A1V2LAG0_CYBFA|nr:Protein PSP1 [Cyberlindnera fabianii]